MTVISPKTYKTWKDTLYLASLAVMAAAFSTLIIKLWGFTTDDAYITLRYATNWYQTGAINWNAASQIPVEGYSNTLYLILAYLALSLSIDPVIFLKVLSITSLLLSLYWLNKLISAYANRWFALFAIVLIVAYPGTVWWTVSGLETATFMFLHIYCLFLFVQALNSTPGRRRNLLFACSLIVFIAGITRPEGPLLGIVIGSALILNHLYTGQSFKTILSDCASLAAPFILLYTIYFLARYSYFGEIWPNTYYCKTGYTGDKWILIEMFVKIAWLPLILGLYALTNTEKRRVTLILYAYVFASVGLLYGVNPVIAYYNRYTLSALVVSVAILAIALHELYKQRPKSFPVIVIPVVSILLFVSQWSDGLDRLELQASQYMKRMTARASTADYINDNNIESYAVGDAGIIPYRTINSDVYDYYCLNSKEYTTFQPPGQKKQYIEWLYTMRPDAVVIVSSANDKLIPRNYTQRLLLNTFNEKSGYADAGIVFGHDTDSFHYRILKRKTGRAAKDD